DLDEPLAWVQGAAERGDALSVGLVGNCAEVLPELVRRRVLPDVLTYQTSAHDELNGYVPAGLALDAADDLRRRDHREYVRRSMQSVADHCRAMVELMRMGAVTFDYGNNLRGQAKAAGLADAFAFLGFVPAYVRPLLCEGEVPFCWAALSGDPEDIRRTNDLVLELFAHDAHLQRWIRVAQERVACQGLPARICWLGQGERAKFGVALNDLVAS